MTVKTTKDTFEKEVLNSDIPVIVDFWAQWCGPCKMLAPTLEEISEEYDGKIKICKVDVDEEPELASAFGIMSIPTLICFENGKLKTQKVGYIQKDAVIDMVI